MIDFETYFDQIISVQMQFDLARKALANFKSTPEAVEKYMEGELEEVQNIIANGQNGETSQARDHWAFNPDGIADFFEQMKANVPQRVREAKGRINQNEYILRVTLFEAFMKEVHREILRQKPELLKPDRQIPLGKIVAIEREKIIEEEIEREVQSLDRKNPKERAKYFLDQLKINWFDGTILPLLEEALSLRNELIHIKPDMKITKMNIGLAHFVFFAIPLISVAQAAAMYPGGFKMIDWLKDESAASP